MRGLILISALAVAAEATRPSSDTLAACSALYSQFQHQLTYDPLGANGKQTASNQSLYRTTNTDYWNAGSSQNRAACIFYPGSAQDVSFAVQVLNNYTSVQYALKSGGHNSNFGFSSVDQGVLISFRPNLAGTTVSSDRQSANVGPGARWDEVSAVLEPFGKTVVGGRLGHVGVGGYLLGGGLSFLTSQYGFACDNVLDYELVLADGTITHANATSNTDLFYALKGGGNQFGIVTSFKLRLFTIGQVWGGTKVYAGSNAPSIIGALSNFTTGNTDPKAAIIPTFDFTIDSLVSIVVVFYFYDGPMPPASVFAQFDAIPSLSQAVSTQSYTSLLTANNKYSLTGLNYQIREATYPVLPYAQNVAFLTGHYNIFKKASAAAITQLDVQVLSFAVQPVPVLLQKASVAAGGNRLGLDPASGDKFFIEYDISWTNRLYTAKNPQTIETLVDNVKAFQTQQFAGIKPTNYQSGDLALGYTPIFMNDGMYDQQVLQSYGADNYAKMKAIQLARDPAGFFSKRQNGFKFST